MDVSHLTRAQYRRPVPEVGGRQSQVLLEKYLSLFGFALLDQPARALDA